MRESGPVHKELQGEDALPYIGFARTLLGQLKADMEFGDLDFGKRAKVLEDGTTVIAISSFGEDKIRIIAPQEPSPEWTPPTPEEPVVLPPEENQWKLRADELDDKVVRICGNSGDDAWVWSPGEPAVTLLPKLGMPISRCYAISGDGAVVVGTCFDTNGHVYAVRWTHGGSGWVADAIGGPDDGLMEAVSINEDGTVIGGHGYAAVSNSPPFEAGTADTPVREWTWTSTGGIQVLPNSHWPSTFPSGPGGASVSPSGKFAAGNMNLIVPHYAFSPASYPNHPIPWIPFGQYVLSSHAATWERGEAGGAFTGPTEYYDGFSYTLHSHFGIDDQSFTYPNQYETNIHGVANDGTFIGALNDNYGFVCRGGTFTYYNPPMRDGDAIDNNDSEQPWGISEDGTRIAGVTISANGNPDQAWVRTDGSKRDLGPGGVYAITPDGLWMAGYSGRDAVYWPYRTGIARTIPSTGQTMWATGIGRIRIQVDEEGAPTVTTKNLTF